MATRVLKKVLIFSVTMKNVNPRNITVKFYQNWPRGLGGEDFLSFYYVHIGKNHDPPGAGPILTPGP
jgi:hypothetical protein